MTRIPRCIDIWGIYSGTFHLEVTNDQLANFLGAHFERRDNAFRSNGNALERKSVSGGTTTFRFTRPEFAQAFCGAYSSQDIAAYLGEHTLLDSPQAQGAVRLLSGLDDYYRYVFGFAFDEDIDLPLREPYAAAAYCYREEGRYFADGSYGYSTRKISGGTYMVDSMPYYLSRIALVSADLREDDLRSLIPKKHWILRRRIDDEDYWDYCNFPTEPEQEGGIVSYGPFHTRRDMGALSLGPSVVFGTSRDHIGEVVARLDRFQHPQPLLLFPNGLTAFGNGGFSRHPDPPVPLEDTAIADRYS